MKQLPVEGGAVTRMFRRILAEAEAEEPEDSTMPREIVTAAEPKAPTLPQHRKDRDDAPPARTLMEREALKRGEQIVEVPLGKMELMLGKGWFSHGTG